MNANDTAQKQSASRGDDAAPCPQLKEAASETWTMHPRSDKSSLMGGREGCTFGMLRPPCATGFLIAGVSPAELDIQAAKDPRRCVSLNVGQEALSGLTMAEALSDSNSLRLRQASAFRGSPLQQSCKACFELLRRPGLLLPMSMHYSKIQTHLPFVGS